MDIFAKISSKCARIGVIGLGYVGLPLLAAFHRAGFNVIGFDIDPAKIAGRRAISPALEMAHRQQRPAPGAGHGDLRRYRQTGNAGVSG